ncbi:hypothetical protein WMY93_005878 [Mugilogobius chulae]|uniref:Endonuclease/exonuclease/phosphatase domain-containing protein n=1 Tax=Mugilogobius chulae TaxID=88201 RepID=A0AAW0PI28_9GOBI
MDIGSTQEHLLKYDFGHRAYTLPPHLLSVPAYLWRFPVAMRKKRPRKRGRRSGVLVKIRTYRRSSHGGNLYPDPAPRCSAVKLRGMRWIQPVFPARVAEGARHLPLESELWHRHRRGSRGVDLGCLKPLGRNSSLGHDEDVTLHLGLINARSLANKTFVLRDFFTSRKLDIMFITETWLRTGETMPFSELLSPDCSFLSLPRSTGRGGGLASVFNTSLHCTEALCDSFSSFELQTLLVNVNPPVFCALVYRPPKLYLALHMRKDIPLISFYRLCNHPKCTSEAVRPSALHTHVEPADCFSFFCCI